MTWGEVEAYMRLGKRGQAVLETEIKGSVFICAAK